MSVKFDVKLTQKVLFDFLLHNLITRPLGVIGALFGTFNLVVGIRFLIEKNPQSALTNILFAALFLGALPYMLWRNAGKQVANSKFYSKPISYELNEEGVTARQGDQSSTIGWDEYQKAMSMPTAIFLIVDKSRVTLLPKDDIGDQLPAVIEVISTHMDPAKVKIRG